MAVAEAVAIVENTIEAEAEGSRRRRKPPVGEPDNAASADGKTDSAASAEVKAASADKESSESPEVRV